MFPMYKKIISMISCTYEVIQGNSLVTPSKTSFSNTSDGSCSVRTLVPLFLSLWFLLIEVQVSNRLNERLSAERSLHDQNQSLAAYPFMIYRWKTHCGEEVLNTAGKRSYQAKPPHHAITHYTFSQHFNFFKFIEIRQLQDFGSE